jgi:adenylate cyclase class 2
MGSPIEREIKLRFDSPELARAAVRAIGAAPAAPRRLQQDSLLDTEDGQLRDRRSVVRVRRDGNASVLTFKGPVQPGPMKVREELETAAGDAGMLHCILDRLGFHPWFRYEKYREEFACPGIVVAVDETPIGTFVELEGSAEGIQAAAAAMGKGPADYVLDSYYRLFANNREALGFRGTDMVFDDPGRTQ